MKAECGILESDSPEEAAAKLERALPEDDRDRAWLKARLAPLVGAPAEPASQEESFTAWRRCLESWAAGRETVLVFEDLHWADPALLSFLEHLADWAEGVPLLVLCTARPELYEQHAAWASGLRNATTINLAPLTDEETAQLDRLAAGAPRCCRRRRTTCCSSGRAATRSIAEEFVRLLSDRGELAEAVERCPTSVQALIAARLDTLSAGPQEPAPGRVGRGQGVLGRGARGDGRSRPTRGGAGAARAGPQGARAPDPDELDGGRAASTASGISWSGTSATRRSRGLPVRPVTVPRRPGSSVRRAGGSRTWPTCSPTTT